MRFVTDIRRHKQKMKRKHTTQLENAHRQLAMCNASLNIQTFIFHVCTQFAHKAIEKHLFIVLVFMLNNARALYAITYVYHVNRMGKLLKRNHLNKPKYPRLIVLFYIMLL